MGYIFDKIKKEDDLFQYMVYIPKLKMTNRLIINKNIDNLSNNKFKIYVFLDEIQLKKKIKLLLIE